MEVRYVNFIREVTHKQIETVEIDGTMKDLLDYECSEYGPEFKNRVYNQKQLSDEVEIFVNGKMLPHDSCLEKRVTDKDRVCISGSSHWH